MNSPEKFQVEISNQQKFIPIDESFFLKVVTSVCEQEKVNSALISIVVMDDPSIRRLNAQYLEHDYETDVLSFLLECTESGGSPSQDEESLRGFGKNLEGEIIISAEMAQNCAPDYEWDPHDELILYLIHGLLHLLGYDDLSYDEKVLMRDREREYLKLFSLTPNYRSDDLE